MINQLNSELSPYLLQHKDNPVAWQPWAEDAFKQAKEHDKPIFLSIGYATCHWCHVMEHESFEDPDVANLMNEAFINIKVDREERPDIDHLYMSVCQLLTGSGGWPLTIIMTPDKRPFFAGTYFPKQSLPNRPGMLELIPAISDAWKNQRDDILVSTQKIMAGLVEHNQLSAPEQVAHDLSKQTFTSFESAFDNTYGGFGNAPKFPMPHHLLFLLRYHQRSNNKDALSMATTTLDAMQEGGLYDQIGFGFHRYSTDANWHTPHFEKMLYDQAQLLTAYSLAYDITQNTTYKNTIDNVVTYLTRDLQGDNAGFFSAEDADSEGEEGTFYVWSYDEVKQILEKNNFDLISKIYQLSPNGNYTDEATRKPTGKNIFHQSPDKASIIDELGLSNKEADSIVTASLIQLHEKRSKRIRPGLDDKILTDWNGLIIAGLAQAGRATNTPTYVKLAEDCADFIYHSMIDKTGKLHHRYRDGSVGIIATAFDYHYFIYGLIHLYQVTFHDHYLEKANTLLQQANSLFWDSSNNTYLISQDDDLLLRQHDSYDGALPAVNSVAYFNLLHLSTYLHQPALFKQAQNLISQFAASINQYPMGYTFWIQAHELLSTGFPILVTTHALTDQQHADLQKFPYLVIQNLADSPYLSNQKQLASFVAIDDTPTFYFCHDFMCKKPTTSFNDVIQYLQ
ncbi:MAG: thioredoxin domain-containing protein [Actinobacteria bacterium]|nr:thioredoxin domain-containing protein [Actinomycetota bacterium]|tara:strand:+ start:4344 stop:6383 length:2040 start_codon:yes stop_codon:yes gene_type:complete